MYDSIVRVAIIQFNGRGDITADLKTCCGLGSASRDHTAIPLEDGVLGVNPQLVATGEGSANHANHAEETRTPRPPLVSPISCASDAQHTNQNINLSTSILVSSPVLPFNEESSMSSSQERRSNNPPVSCEYKLNTLSHAVFWCRGVTDLEAMEGRDEKLLGDNKQ
ncbi:hypothetical protein NECAME_08283 [Necator americanus]|uniref:Uncharacterized protein n=1 Tax=Necator americanus TaxID=51031 RepID=W2TIX6_NECAM|nr:hypothetical protein NECAME_08283 [Necator americanus]ETN81743.1 hypothetical protein NECAME_08283 [Necator americanus]